MDKNLEPEVIVMFVIIVCQIFTLDNEETYNFFQ